MLLNVILLHLQLEQLYDKTRISDLAQQTAEGSSQTTASASELTRLAIQLNELVSKFKV